MNTENKTLAKENVTEFLKNSLDDRGLPVFGVIEIEGEDGSFTEAYKRESSFTRDDYRKAAAYQRKLADYHSILADYYSAEMKKREFQEILFNGRFNLKATDKKTFFLYAFFSCVLIKNNLFLSRFADFAFKLTQR